MANRRRVLAIVAILLISTIGVVGLFSRLRGRGDGGATNRSALLAERLDQLGLWRDLSDSERNASKKFVAEGGHPWSTEISPTVMFMADGEDLAEGGVEGFLVELAPVLAVRGVTLRVELLVDPAEDGGYAVGINGQRVEIYADGRAFETSNEASPWFAATVRPLAAVNRLLASAGATERFFTLYTGGNEGLALLIDPRIAAALVSAGLDDPKERPRLAE